MQINWVYLTVELIFDTNTWDQFNKIFKPHANGRNFVGQHSEHCWMLLVASVCTLCYMLFGVVAQSLKQVKLLRQQLLTFLLFLDRRSVAQQCWIRLHNSSFAPRTRITPGLQSLMGCILPTMHCRYQHC